MSNLAGKFVSCNQPALQLPGLDLYLRLVLVGPSGQHAIPDDRFDAVLFVAYMTLCNCAGLAPWIASQK